MPSERQLVSAHPRSSSSSRDEPRKGLQFAWNTFERLKRDVPTARLVVVGLAEPPRGLPVGAQSLGRVDEKTLTQALRAADVVFVPSLFEAFSRVVIEAWQQETPVVVSDGVALGAVVRELGGEPVAYGNASAGADELRRLLTNHATSRAAGSGGRALVLRRYLLDGLADRTERLYDALTGTEQAVVEVRTRAA
jgi:glycosyltransferase involved in cell wall biosynthesis